MSKIKHIHIDHIKGELKPQTWEFKKNKKENAWIFNNNIILY